MIVQNYAPELGSLAPNFTATTPLDNNALNALGPNDPNNILAWTTVPAVPLSNGGFANVSVTLDGIEGRQLEVAAGTTLTVQPGGSITLKGFGGHPVDILGNLIAPSGTISILGGDAVTVGPNAVLDAAGEWVNQTGQSTATPETADFINGGSISVATSSGGSTILLSAGSVLDVSSGGLVQSNGQLEAHNGIPVGAGGNVAIKTGSLDSNHNVAIAGGFIELDGTIKGWGFSGGGTLALQAESFQIGGDSAQVPEGVVYLPADFFAGQGFSNYQINAWDNIDVVPGTAVPLTHLNRLPTAALTQAPSGTDITAGGLTSLGSLDPYDRSPTNLAFVAGGQLLGGGASAPPAGRDRKYDQHRRRRFDRYGCRRLGQPGVARAGHGARFDHRARRLDLAQR